MNRTKIEWCTHTWNPMTGCLHGCPYCYARKIATRFKGTKAWPVGFAPSFRRERLGEPCDLKKPAIIFAGSVTDIFGDWWDGSQIFEVLRVMDSHLNIHKFVVLTKNPEAMTTALHIYRSAEGTERLQNVYFGTSVTGALPSSDEWLDEMKRLDDLAHVHAMGYKTAISFEPLLHDPTDLIKISGGVLWADWIIIGGQTNPNIVPDLRWIMTLDDATTSIPFFVKDNALTGTRLMRQYYHDAMKNRRFPVDLLPIAQAWGKA